MSRQGRVSWRPLDGARLFGVFAGWTPDGLAKVRRGSVIHYLDRGDITWEMN